MSSDDLRDSRRGDVLFVVLVVISYITIFSSGIALTPLQIGVLIAAGVVYALVGLFGFRACERSRKPLAIAAYFGVEISLGTLILYLGQSGAWLAMLPLAGHAVALLPRRWMVIVCALILAGMAIATALFLLDMVDEETGERLFTPSSGPFWLGVLNQSLAYGAAILFVVLFTQIAVREREAHAEVERLASELREANSQLRAYAAQAEELATLRERTRLAREIHDGLGHHLTAINMQIQAGRAVLAVDRAAAFDALDKAQGLAQRGLTEVRRSVSALRASPLDNRSLADAVGELVDECRAAGIATGYVIHGETPDLAPQVKMALYRVAQEGLTNLRKHAQASSAEVVFDYRDASRVGLTVRDQGIGSDDPTGGYGLIGIRERVQLLGGEVRVETAPGEGFALMVEVPVEA
jgi:signal transduction histidine kinase